VIKEFRVFSVSKQERFFICLAAFTGLLNGIGDGMVLC